MAKTAIESKVEVTSLLTTAPEQATQSFSGSIKLMKILTSTALGALMYYRKLLPEDAFTVYNIKGKDVPYLKLSTSYGNVNLFRTLVESIRNTLDKGYLKEVIINLYEDANKTDTPIESYVYKYNHIISKEEERQHNKDLRKRSEPTYVQQKIFSMMEQSKLAFTCKEELPKDCEVAIYVKYTDKVPDDYICPGFNNCDLIPEAKKKMSVQLGRITTPYHQLKVYNHLDELMEFINEGNEKMESSQQMVKHLFESNTLFEEQDNQMDGAENGNKTPPQEKKKKRSLSLKKQTNNDYEEDEFSNLHCPCKRNFTSSFLITIICQICHKGQHAECFGLTDKCMKKDFVHYCDTCAEKNSDIVCSDPGLVHKTCDEKKWICLIRKTLSSFNYYRDIDVPLLMSVQYISRPVAKKLFQWVSEMGVFKANISKRKSSIRSVDDRALQDIIPKYFKVTSSTVSPTKKISQQIDHIQLNDEDEIMLTPNVLTWESIDYSPSKTEEQRTEKFPFISDNKLHNSSPVPLHTRRSIRLKGTAKRYMEDVSGKESEEEPFKKMGSKKNYSKRVAYIHQ